MNSRRKKNDKLYPQYQIHKQQDPMAWVVRHCSPNIVIHHPTDDDKHGDQSDPLGFSDWCAPVDWRSVRLKDTD